MDPRGTPVNDRVVAAWLAASFPDRRPVAVAEHFAAVPVLDLCRTPGGARDRQLAYGETFEVLEIRDGHAFGIAALRDYVGWVDAAGLKPAEARGEAVDWVVARQTHVYPEPDFKRHEICALPHLSLLHVEGQEGRFSRTELGWVPTAHLGQDRGDDQVAVAALYLGTPYLWGGNSVWGIDCSGLVQNALGASGFAVPGDSDLQEKALGETLPEGTAPQRGDLLFWKGHVAWVSDPDTILHANAHAMAVTYEPLREAVARIDAQGGGPVTRHARLT